MEAKKSPKADLEKRKGLFLEIGLVTILALCLFAFNMKSYDQKEVESIQRTAIDEVDEVIMNTQEQETPPPPEPEVPDVVTEVNIIDNDAESEHELGIIDMGDDANKQQETFVPIEVTAAPVEEEVEEIFQFVEEQASFPGGDEALYKYLYANIKYPDLAVANNIEGKVYVQFVVEKDGRISNVVVKRDIGAGCGDEAKRVIQSLPKWNPGKQRGKAVRSYFTLPVSFTLK